MLVISVWMASYKPLFAFYHHLADIGSTRSLNNTLLTRQKSTAEFPINRSNLGFRNIPNIEFFKFASYQFGRFPGAPIQ